MIPEWDTRRADHSPGKGVCPVWFFELHTSGEIRLPSVGSATPRGENNQNKKTKKKPINGGGGKPKKFFGGCGPWLCSVPGSACRLRGSTTEERIWDSKSISSCPPVSVLSMSGSHWRNFVHHLIGLAGQIKSVIWTLQRGSSTLPDPLVSLSVPYCLPGRSNFHLQFECVQPDPNWRVRRETCSCSLHARVKLRAASDHSVAEARYVRGSCMFLRCLGLECLPVWSSGA